jgi:hypothetical protein
MGRHGLTLLVLLTACAKPQTFEEGMREVCALDQQLSVDAGVDHRVEDLVTAYKARVTNVGVHAILDSTTDLGGPAVRDATIAEALRISGIGPCWLRPPDAGR